MWSFKEFWLTEKTKKQERETVRDENQINSLCEAGFFSTAIPFAQHQVCCRELTVNNITAWDGSVVKCAAMPESRWPPSNRNARGSCWPGAGAEAAPLQWGLHAELGDTPGCWPRLGCGLGSLICCRFLKQFLSLAYKWGTWGKEREIEPVCIPFLEFSPLRQNHQNWLRECEGKCIKNWGVEAWGWGGMSKHWWQIHYYFCLYGEDRVDKSNRRLWTCYHGLCALSPLKSPQLQLLYK